MTAILIVDDHEIVRRGLRQVLVEGIRDVRTGEAASADEALVAVARERWDLMILDINLPGRSGIEALGQLRSERPELPVLVVSAYPEEDLAVRCIRLGAVGYVTKASAADELLTAVRKVLAGGRYVTASLAERLAEVLGSGVTQEPHEALSTRELQVLRMVASGRTLKEIALELHLSEKTVATYRKRITEKMRISTRMELARYAVDHHLIR